MNTSLEHLPDYKQRQLKEIAGIIVKAVDPEKVILFGSHATGRWVEHRYTEDGITYEYISDYDLESSKYQYGIHKAADIMSTGFKSDDNHPGGGGIYYTQNGGSTPDFSSASSPVALGHELYHGWAYEYSNQPKGADFGSRLAQETGAVKFENYLRASFGEKEMREYYTLRGDQ